MDQNNSRAQLGAHRPRCRTPREHTTKILVFQGLSLYYQLQAAHSIVKHVSWRNSPVRRPIF
jgi:hypothetical protein